MNIPQEVVTKIDMRLDSGIADDIDLALDDFEMRILPAAYGEIPESVLPIIEKIEACYLKECDVLRKGRMVFLLGKLCSPALMGFFKDILREQLNGDSGVLWQAIVALDNLNEPILEPTGGSSRDTEINRNLAIKYLSGSK